MRNILYPLSWVAGVVATHSFATLPRLTDPWVLGFAVVSVLAVVSVWVLGLAIILPTRLVPTSGVNQAVASQSCHRLSRHGWWVDGWWINGWWIEGLRVALIALLCASIGMTYTVWRANRQLADHLSQAEDNKVTRVPVLIAELPEKVDGGVRLVGEVEAFAHSGRFPKRVLIDWPGACTGDCAPGALVVQPGQRWRMALRFRHAHGRMNPHGFDAVGWLFQRGIRATATVRGEPVRLADASPWRPSLWVVRLRAHIRARMLKLLPNQREAPVMVALSIGDQQGVSAADWKIFNITGITHLVSISGSHVTLIAALGAALLTRLYGRLRWRSRWLCERLPNRLVFVWSAVVAAFFYCLLAGWGVPAQRTFFMLVCAAAGLSGRLPLTGFQAVALAAVFMTLLDPWSVLSTGFWLSFGAVSVLIAVAEQSPRWALATGIQAQGGLRARVQRCCRALALATHLQVVMTMVTMPVLAYLFQQVSFASLAANAWAIPWVTFLATPLALLLSGATLLPVPDQWLQPLAWLAHESLYWSLWPVRWLAGFEWMAIEVSAMPLPWLALGLVGVIATLGLPPSAWRWCGYLLMLPGFLYRPPGPIPGAWQLTVFDVGQGGAALIKTHSQTLLFDTGWRFGAVDAMERVILPVLRAQGIKRLDRVVISHPDNDHVGGLSTLQAERTIGQLLGAGVPGAQACRRDQHWQVDGVRFEFLHPQDDCAQAVLSGAARNRCSCVLKITGRWHSALLPGDIDEIAEDQIIAMSGGVSERKGLKKARIDVMVMPHHGSRTGSSDGWVQWSGAQHAVAQAGLHNRFGHPHAPVMRRWQQQGTRTWLTARDGAVVFDSKPSGLSVVSLAEQRQRYWHVQDGNAVFDALE